MAGLKSRIMAIAVLFLFVCLFVSFIMRLGEARLSMADANGGEPEKVKKLLSNRMTPAELPRCFLLHTGRLNLM